MNAKTKMLAVLIAALVAGSAFLAASAASDGEKPKAEDKKLKLLRLKEIRVAAYVKKNGVETSVEGKLIGYRMGVLGVQVGDDKVRMLCSPRFTVGGEEKTWKDLKDWKGADAPISALKVEVKGKETRTLYLVQSITVGGVTATAVYPTPKAK